MESLAIAILHVNRIEMLKKCLESLEKSLKDKVDWDVFVLQQGFPEYLDILEKMKEKYLLHIFYSEKNLGCGGGRRFLQEKIKDKYDYVMYLDDDIVLERNWWDEVKKCLEEFERVGIPLFKPSGRVDALCKDITIVRPFLFRLPIPPRLFRNIREKENCLPTMEVANGCCVIRGYVNTMFEWYPYPRGFDDVDVTLQLLKNGVSTCLATRTEGVHYHVLSGGYGKIRFRAPLFYESYKMFIKRWGLIYPPVQHLCYYSLAVGAPAQIIKVTSPLSKLEGYLYWCFKTAIRKR